MNCAATIIGGKIMSDPEYEPSILHLVITIIAAVILYLVVLHFVKIKIANNNLPGPLSSNDITTVYTTENNTPRE